MSRDHVVIEANSGTENRRNV